MAIIQDFMIYITFCIFSLYKQANCDSTIQYCPFFNNRAPSAQPELKNCTWYKENSCCMQQEIEETFGKVKPLKGASKSCQSYANYLMCYICSPNQNAFYQNERLTVCESFCNEFYEACGSAILKGSHIEHLYKNGTQFCLSRRFLVDSHANCFSINKQHLANSGIKTSPHSAFAILLFYTIYALLWLSPCSVSMSLFCLSKWSAEDIKLNYRISYNYLTVCSIILLFILPNTKYVCAIEYKTISQENVYSWAQTISEELHIIAQQALGHNHFQRTIDELHHSVEYINNTQEIMNVRNELSDFFMKRRHMSENVAQKIQVIFDHNSSFNHLSKDLDSLSRHVFVDADFIADDILKNCEYNNKFRTSVCVNQSSVKIAPNINHQDMEVINAIQMSSAIDSLFQSNSNDDPTIRWQYFGSAHGILRVYPGKEWQRNFVGFSDDYDPRTRPWYQAVTSAPKDVVIILDVSTSMSSNQRLHRLKSVTKSILRTLTKLDRVNIVLSRSPYWNTDGDYFDKQERVLSCTGNDLISATTSNIQELITLLETVEADGGSDHLPAFTKAFNMLEISGDVETSCQKVLIFITDGQTKDSFNTRCSKGYHRYREDNSQKYVPGRMCWFDYDDFPKKIEQLQHKLSRKANIFAFLVDGKEKDSHDFVIDIPCQNNGAVIKISKSADILSQMGPYYEHLRAASGEMTSEWTSPYLDQSGLGLMMTVSTSVYSNVTGRIVDNSAVDDYNALHLGVVGIDVPLEEVENILRRSSWGEVYAFVVDRNDMAAVVHPFVKPTVELISDPIFVPIYELETHNGKPEKFHEVLEGIATGETGSITIEAPEAIRAVSIHESLSWRPVHKVTYAYTSIPGTDLAVVLNIGGSDSSSVQIRHMSSPGPASFLHHMEQYKQLSQELPALYEQLAPRKNNSRYPDVEISERHSVVKLAPRSFCHPGKFLQSGVPNFTEMHHFVNDYSGDFDADCPEGIYVPGVKTDVQLTADLGSTWLSRDETLQKDVTWTYVGTRNGVMRIYPGVRMRPEYDPTKRGWYHRTQANGLTLSNVYLDAIPKIGHVVTLSKAVTTRTPATAYECDGLKKNHGCPCDSDSVCISDKCGDHGNCQSNSVHAVVAMDMLYTNFHARIMDIAVARAFEQFCGSTYHCVHSDRCYTKCYIVTDTARLSFDEDLLMSQTHMSNDDTNTKIADVTLASKQGHVFAQLVQQGVFVQQTRTDYQAVCQFSPPSPEVKLEVNIDQQSPSSHVHYSVSVGQGPIPPFRNDYNCMKKVVYYTANKTAFDDDRRIIEGNLDNDPCGDGRYFFAPIPGLNVYLLVLADYRPVPTPSINCHISNSVLSTGSFEIEPDMCNVQRNGFGRSRRRCQPDQDVVLPCGHSHSMNIHIQYILPFLIASLISLVLLI